MKLRMAKGSLFAILLRSTWWYSMLIGLVILGISLAATDAQYIILSITGSMPFFCIGGYACYKQWKQPSAKKVAEFTEAAKKLTATVIAQKVAHNYTNSGFTSAPYKGNGADLVLTRNSEKLLLSSKRFKAANTGVDPLKLLHKAIESAQATGAIYVTMGEVSAAAQEYAQAHNIEIVEAARLAVLVNGKTKIA